MQLETINILILHSEEYSAFKAHELHFVLLFAAGLMSAPREDSFRHLCEPHTTAIFKSRSWKWETAEFVQWSPKSCANYHCRLQMLPSEWHSLHLPEKGFGPQYLIPVQRCYRHVYGEMKLGEATHLTWLASVRCWEEMKPFTLQRWGSFALSLYITSVFHTERALGSGLSWRKAKLWIMIYQ